MNTGGTNGINFQLPTVQTNSNGGTTLNIPTLRVGNKAAQEGDSNGETRHLDVVRFPGE